MRSFVDITAQEVFTVISMNLHHSTDDLTVVFTLMSCTAIPSERAHAISKTCFHEVLPMHAIAVMLSTASPEHFKTALIYNGNGNYHNIFLLRQSTATS